MVRTRVAQGWWLCARALLAALWSAIALVAHAGEPAAVMLNGAESDVILAPYAQVLEDPSRRLGLAQVRTAGNPWLPGPADALNFGFSHSVWWARMRLANPTAQTQTPIVRLGSPLQDHVHWFVVNDRGETVQENITGDRTPFATRMVPYRDFLLPVTLAPHETLDVYLRLDTHDGLFEAMRLSLSTRNEFFARANTDVLIFGLYFGALLAISLYNLFLFVSTRQAAFGYYVGYLVSFFIWGATYRGFSLEYLWPEWPDLNNQILAVSASLSFITFGLFAIRYLRMAERVPAWVTWLYLGLVTINGLCIPLAWLDCYALFWMINIPLGMVLIVLILVIGMHLMLRGHREALFFEPAFVMLGVGVIVVYLQIANLVPVNFFTTNAMQIGSFLEIVLLAFGLADSMNVIKAQMLQAEQEAHEAQTMLNAKLEHQVQDRTQALEHANRRLNELAITDELTGAFNRRHFNEFCRAALARRSRGEPLALCMFDIDHFKSYNDHYGHQAGDTALRDLSHAVQAELKRSGDQLFRLGGEEFGMLLSASSLEMVAQFVERQRLVVWGLQRPHVGNPAGVMTASFGAAWWDSSELDSLSPDEMYAAADALLYEAKKQGRNCVVTRSRRAVRAAA